MMEFETLNPVPLASLSADDFFYLDGMLHRRCNNQKVSKISCWNTDTDDPKTFPANTLVKPLAYSGPTSIRHLHKNSWLIHSNTTYHKDIYQLTDIDYEYDTCYIENGKRRLKLSSEQEVKYINLSEQKKDKISMSYKTFKSHPVSACNYGDLFFYNKEVCLFVSNETHPKGATCFRFCDQREIYLKPSLHVDVIRGTLTTVREVKDYNTEFVLGDSIWTLEEVMDNFVKVKNTFTGKIKTVKDTSTIFILKNADCCNEDDPRYVELGELLLKDCFLYQGTTYQVTSPVDNVVARCHPIANCTNHEPRMFKLDILVERVPKKEKEKEKYIYLNEISNYSFFKYPNCNSVYQLQQEGFNFIIVNMLTNVARTIEYPDRLRIEKVEDTFSESIKNMQFGQYFRFKKGYHKKVYTRIRDTKAGSFRIFDLQTGSVYNNSPNSAVITIEPTRITLKNMEPGDNFFDEGSCKILKRTSNYTGKGYREVYCIDIDSNLHKIPTARQVVPVHFFKQLQ